jgi:AraC-like DNA-binding protein
MLRFSPFQLRGTTEPTIPLPLACRSVGHYRNSPGWEDRVKRKPFAELFWGVVGQGRFTIDEVDVTLGPDQVLVLYSGETHYIRADTAWDYRWLTVDGRMADELLRAFGFERRPRRAGPCPHGHFERLERLVIDTSPAAQRAASAITYEILALAAASGEEAQPCGWDEQIRRCVGLIQEGFTSPALSVADLAERLGVDRTRLCKSFKARMQQAPSDYIAALRISEALRLLCGSDLPIAEVARRSGFASPGYFSSAVRRQTGRSPAELRRGSSGRATGS